MPQQVEVIPSVLFNITDFNSKIFKWDILAIDASYIFWCSTKATTTE
jgi:hypothetical protein